MGMMDTADGGEDIKFLIADVVDAFWLIPLHPSERRFFVSNYKSKYVVFLRTAQGSRGAPLTWASIAALLARCVQGLFATANGQEARIQKYADDPLLTVKGTKQHRRMLVVRFAAAYRILGFALAFPKAQLSKKVTWIGVTLTVGRGKVIASIPPEKLSELILSWNKR